MKYFLIPFVIFSLVILHRCTKKLSMNTIDTATIKNFELNRYLGTWYEIARFPHRFEKDLVGVTATYSLRKDGLINVLNKGYKYSLSGKVQSAEGKAKPTKDKQAGKLKVSFFLFFYADYNILELDYQNYSYALIGSSTSDYLWILSRTAVMDDSIYTMLVERARKRGYDISKLKKVPQQTP